MLKLGNVLNLNIPNTAELKIKLTFLQRQKAMLFILIMTGFNKSIISKTKTVQGKHCTTNAFENFDCISFCND